MVTVESEERRRAESRFLWPPRRFGVAYMAGKGIGTPTRPETSQKRGSKEGSESKVRGKGALADS